VSEDELVRSLVDAERDGRRRLADVLDALDDEHASLARFLRIKEEEDRARVAHRDRTAWHRQLSWRLVRAVFFFGIVSGLLFVVLGDERAIEPAIWFIGGGATYYLFAQVVTLGRARADDRGLRAAEERARQNLDALAASLER